MASDPSIRACIWIIIWQLPDNLHRVVWVGQVHFSLCELNSHRLTFPILAHFSENWGYASFSPLVLGNLFSLMFGRYLDAHAPTQDTRSSLGTRVWTLASRELPSEHQCFDGKECYLGSLQVTLVACIISLGLSWWAGVRDGQKVRARNAFVRG